MRVIRMIRHWRGMAFDEVLAGRLRALLVSEPGISEKKMFGGVAYMVHGNMACGIVGQDLMLRLGPKRFSEALSRPYTRPMDFSGRPMAGMVYVAPQGFALDEDLRRWVDPALAFVRALPAKVPKAAKKRLAGRLGVSQAGGHWSRRTRMARRLPS